ncbi:MAG: hypothetical protein K940chlam9_00856 [Chlamydiae bacterium]|nr:hypothetical protein [Chlamydiota bacterium]
MRRSICHTQPPITRAGEVGTWRFLFTTATSLPKGTRLKFDLQSAGRDIDWQIPTADLSQEGNVIYAEMEDGEILEAKEIETPDSFVPQFEFTLPSPIKIGGQLVIVVGAHPEYEESEDTGNEAQLTVQRRRPFHLYIDTKGKGNYDDPEVFSIDIRGSKLHNIRVLVPSFVSKNKRFDVTVRFEDEYGNLTNFAPEDTLIDLSYEHLRENLNWKLFVPETGFVILPNLYFNEAGIYRIQLRNMKSKETFISSPIKCFQENSRNLFWGLLHGESERVDSTENIENCMRHFRDEQALNFFAVSPFDNTEETSNDTWKLLSQNVAEFNEEDRFATFLSFQFVGEPKKEGVRQFIYTKDNKPLLRQKDSKSSSLQKIYKSHTPKDFLSIPSFTMGKGFSFNFEQWYPEFERVVEIYNAWGSSEQTKKKGNSHPITGGIEEIPEGAIVDALKKNRRFGFVAGGLDDRGIYGDFFESDQVQYSPGYTGIICEKYTRESMWEALYNRSCYATTGTRILMGFHIAGHPMGSEIETGLKPGLLVNRHISGYIAGTAKLEKVEVIRNGEVIHTFSPTGYHFDYYYDDMDPFEQVVLKPKEGSPFAFYYLRVTQEDGHIGWSSPIWVDLTAPVPAKGKKGG